MVAFAILVGSLFGLVMIMRSIKRYYSDIEHGTMRPSGVVSIAIVKFLERPITWTIFLIVCCSIKLWNLLSNGGFFNGNLGRQIAIITSDPGFAYKATFVLIFLAFLIWMGWNVYDSYREKSKDQARVAQALKRSDFDSKD